MILIVFFVKKNSSDKCFSRIFRNYSEQLFFCCRTQNRFASNAVKPKIYCCFRLTDKKACLLHCVKNVRIRSYSGPYFPTFGLNTERYGVSLRRISPYSVQMLENADQNNSEYRHFSRSATDTRNRFISNWPSDVNLLSKIHGSTLFHEATIIYNRSRQSGIFPL